MKINHILIGLSAQLTLLSTASAFKFGGCGIYGWDPLGICLRPEIPTAKNLTLNYVEAINSVMDYY